MALGRTKRRSDSASSALFRSLSQPEELLLHEGHVVGIRRGRTWNVEVRTGDVRRGLQRPSRRPGQYQIVSLLRKSDARRDHVIRNHFTGVEDFRRIKIR